MKKTEEPVVVTVKLPELKEQSEVEILRHRLASQSRNKGRSAEDFFNEFFAGNNIAVEDCEKAPQGDRLDVLVTLVEAWEEKHWPIDLPGSASV